MKAYSVNRMIEIAIAMSTEKDITALLELILKEAMDITNCDGGTVYVREKDGLHFHNMITLSKGFHRKRTGKEELLPPVPMTRSHVCACAAMDHKKIRIEDVYLSDTYDFSGAAKYDKYNGYRTKSMLVIPMEDEKGRNIGVLQLINAMDAEGNIIGFDPEDEEIITALSSLAAISMNNSRLAKSVYDILHSFVTVMVDAVDARSSYNANHTKSMVHYADRFLTWLEENGAPWQVPEEERDPFLMSVWLHDIGKLVIPLEIMDKATRLGDREERVMNRIQTACLMEQIRGLKNPEEAASAAEAEEKLKEAAEVIRKADTAGFLPDEVLDKLAELRDYPCLQPDMTTVPLFTPEEYTAITVRRGTLTAEERREIERHVEYTGSLLGKMVFEGDYTEVPGWAAMHHEFLNGTGYPNHRKGDEIPPEVRLITILDVYDALTAEDRPYKPPMPPERAFSILESMRDEGKLDGEMLRLFRESGAWKKNAAEG
ncbi:MAG: GAF domain-containing protein [Clostridium sp.]|nr:GAF domain-containing protein [Clostridium sp.]